MASTASTAAATADLPAPHRRLRVPLGGVLAGGSMLWLSIIVLLPIAAIIGKAFDLGFSGLWEQATTPEALKTLKFTFLLSAAAAIMGAIAGTAVAWVLVRDEFRGKRLLNGLVDLPFALPTIVAGLTLLALYGPDGVGGVNIAYTQIGVLVALLFVTLPFGVRAVQPVLIELDRDTEAAAASLGAKSSTIARRVILPALRPAILSGMALAFARAIGEFGAVVLISGNRQELEYSSVFIAKQLESGTEQSAAAVATALLLVSLIVLLVLEFFERRSAR